MFDVSDYNPPLVKCLVAITIVCYIDNILAIKFILAPSQTRRNLGKWTQSQSK